MQTLKAIIFDLGGVIIDLQEEKTIAYFSELSGKPEGEIRSIVKLPAFQHFEKGLIPENAFRNAVRTHLGITAPDKLIDEGWNAMLGEIPRARLKLLNTLKKKYQLFLLSNTNSIHLRAFSAIVKNTIGKETLDGFFDRAYYSHEIKMRKPDVETFEWVLKQNNLNPSETLFLDDNLLNIQGAQTVGIQTVHVTHPDLILNLFHED